ncbi:MAG TPA: DUF559 domain-containing protein, partial [Polyangiaceae bacterium]|nr:DUF559 domain-containing protein [Polyangiaceae bacterium]
ALTASEQRLWLAIRGGALGVWFRRQVPLGRFIGDFVAVSARLVVEAAGARPSVARTPGVLEVRHPSSRRRRSRDGSLQIESSGARRARPAPVERSKCTQGATGETVSARQRRVFLESSADAEQPPQAGPGARALRRDERLQRG